MNKVSVAKTFSKAAASYDDAAHLQRHIADELFAKLKSVHVPRGGTALDMGTGTGYCLPKLQQLARPDHIIAADISSDMLNIARRKLPEVETRVCDLEAEPFAANSIDVAVSSLAVQWLESPALFIQHMQKALRPGGVMALATLGPRTLWELRQAWAMVDDVPHVNRFHDGIHWLEPVWECGFETILWREQRLQVRYQSPMTLLHELKQLGASHVDRPAAPGRNRLRQMLQCYEQFRCRDGHFPATWDVYYLIVRKPELS
ncbi:malonyl-ACP O-methyltransferase BioC [Reinekea marinisedimentorum]|uniref:Malonyl-[acyl-carrier protein] O-methyltransferase n=1 Tax=Reinekea marinisedimentorum TaxID=230495 RepID=A0A4R3I0F9_9GAMM|nr:malonyl-ACP O-methyltransferase BioC [Reinekea marinisedimentorum]TCS38141.1 malonyl-CoA O-methyltransferase [Reinekea marinisedimentorum]